MAIDINSQGDDLQRAVRQIEPRTLAGSQMARRIVGICAKPTTDFDLFDRYMESFGLLSYFDPNQKRSIRLTVVALLQEGLLEEVEDGVYRGTEQALEVARELVEFDGTPEVVLRQLSADTAFSTSIRDISISTSTSTSCKCSSSSCSSAASAAPPSPFQRPEQPLACMSATRIL